MKIDGNNYILMTDWEKHHSWPSLNGIRNIRAIADKGDKQGAISFFKKIGGRIFIDENAFLAWASRQVRD